MLSGHRSQEDDFLFMGILQFNVPLGGFEDGLPAANARIRDYTGRIADISPDGGGSGLQFVVISQINLVVVYVTPCVIF